MTFYKWSQIAAANATADATVNYAEGQAPSSLNDSARAEMAALAKYRDDNGSNLTTTGTATSYSLSTNQLFDSRAHLANQEVCFVAHVTNGVNPTLLIDGIGGSFPIVIDDSGTPVPNGSMVAGGVYTVTFDNPNSRYRLKSFFVNPYNVPIGGGMIYFGTTVPNSNFAFPNGQAISRTTYSELFGLIGTTYGSGDGSTTFNLPDLTGCVPAMREAAATRLPLAFFGVDSTVLGSRGGAASQSLTAAQLPSITPAGTVSSITPSGTISSITPAGTISSITPAGTISSVSPSGWSVSVSSTALFLQGGASDNFTSTAGSGQFQNLTKQTVVSTGGAGSITGAAVTPTFTGSSTTPTFTGSPVTPTFTGNVSAAPTFAGTPFGGGQAHPNVQPTLITNYIMRII